MDIPTRSTDPQEINTMARLAAKGTGRVMVRDESRDDFGPKARRHLKLYFDGPHDVYVRTGKRGQCVERLISYRVSCVDPLVVCFKSSHRRDS